MTTKKSPEFEFFSSVLTQVVVLVGGAAVCFARSSLYGLTFISPALGNILMYLSNAKILHINMGEFIKDTN